MPNVTSVWDFSPGETLTAAKLDDVNCGIHVFSGTATRDAAYGGSGERTLAEGEFAYLADSNTTQYYDGAAWQTLVVGGLTLVKTQTIGSAVSSVSVTNAFSSTYDNYKITVSGGAGSAAAINLRLTFGATATGYYYAGVGLTYAGAGNNDNGSNAAYLIGGIASTEFIQMNCDVLAPQLADRTVVTAPYVPTATASGAMRYYGGFLNNDTQYTDFTLTTDTGTLTGGTIRVYGYANS